MGWYKPYNISGTADIGDRLDTLVAIVRSVLRSEGVGLIGHFTGATTVCGHSDRALFISTGFKSRDFFAHVSGHHLDWLAFAHELEMLLQLADIPFSLVVHDHTINAESLGDA